MTKQNILQITALFLVANIFSFSYIDFQDKQAYLAAVPESNGDVNYAESLGSIPPYITFSEGPYYDKNNGGAVFYSLKQKKGTIPFPVVANGELLSKPIYLYPTSLPAPYPKATSIALPHEGESVNVWGINYTAVDKLPLDSNSLVMAPYISPFEGQSGYSSSEKIYLSKSEALEFWKVKSWDVGTSFTSDLYGSFKANGTSGSASSSERYIAKGNPIYFKAENDVEMMTIDCEYKELTEIGEQGGPATEVRYPLKEKASAVVTSSGPFYDKSTGQYYITINASLGDKVSTRAAADSKEVGKLFVFGREFNLYTEYKGYLGCDGQHKDSKVGGYVTLKPLSYWNFDGKKDNTAEALKMLGINPDGSESGNRAYLDYNDVLVNKAANPGSKNSTEVETLTKDTLDRIIALKNASGLRDCDSTEKDENKKRNNCLTVTGGTEIGHKTHGKNKPIVDIRKNPTLNNFILNQSGKDISVNSIGNVTYYIRTGDYAGAYTNEVAGTPAAHWHVVYDGKMPAPKKDDPKKPEKPAKNVKESSQIEKGKWVGGKNGLDEPDGEFTKKGIFKAPDGSEPGIEDNTPNSDKPGSLKPNPLTLPTGGGMDTGNPLLSTPTGDEPPEEIKPALDPKTGQPLVPGYGAGAPNSSAQNQPNDSIPVPGFFSNLFAKINNFLLFGSYR